MNGVIRPGLVATCLAAAVLGGAGPTTAESPRNPWVAVGAVRFDVRGDVASQIPEAWRLPEAQSEGASVGGYRLVKFSGPVGSRRREQLRAAGYAVIACYPVGAFLVRPEAGRPSTELSAIDGTAWVGDFHPYFKIDESLAEFWDAGDPRPLLGQTEGWGLRFVVGLHETAGRPAVEAAIRALPGDPELLPARGPIRVRIDPAGFAAFLPAAAALTEVAYVEPWLPVVAVNDENVQTAQSGVCDNNGNEAPNTSIFNRGITGWGSRLAVADTCFDANEGWFYDEDLDRLPAHETSFPWTSQPADFAQRKIVEYYDMAWNDGTMGCAGATGCASGSFCPRHGTHVAGIIASNCNLNAEGIATATDAANSDSDDDGMAPGAKLVMQDLGNGGYDYLLSGDLGELVRVAYLNTCDGADCFIDAHNASWGSLTSGYTLDARTADEELWDLKQPIVVAAAGNGGAYGSVISPSVGKNVISVGNAENCTVHDVRPTSSRGASSDGRLKPDVVVSGSQVVSAANDGDGASNSNGDCEKLSDSGTSMSSPAIAGLSGLMMQYFRDGFYPSGTRTPANALNPSGPLRKAMLINAGQRMTGAGAEQNGVTWPNMDQGWGFVVLDNVLYFAGESRKLWIRDEPVGVDVSGTSSMSFQRRVTSSAEPLKATLAWYDVEHPGSCGGSSPCLLNDLDLTVTDETSSFVYRTTLVDGTAGHVVPRTVVASSPGVGQTTTNNGPDDLNPVEQIVIYDPTPETVYTITVTAANTPDGPIPFGLVVTGDQRHWCDVPIPGAAPTVTDLEVCAGSGVRVDWAQDPADWRDSGQGSRSYRVLREGAPIAAGGCAGVFSYPGSSCIDDTGPDNFSVDYRIEYVNGCTAAATTPPAAGLDALSHTVSVLPEGTQTTCFDQPLEFTATVDLYQLGYEFQWLEDEAEMPGEASGTLFVTKDAVASHQYSCRVTQPTTQCVAEDPTPAGGSWTADPGICPETVDEVSSPASGRPLRVRRSGAGVDILFEELGATNYNVYVSTKRQTSPFEVTGGIGKKDCDVSWDLHGETGIVTGYDIEAGLVPSSVHFILVTGDDGSASEGSLGFSTTAERSADSYCDR